ncbi:MAG: hypothetical protein ABR582_14385 [Gemmatimonadaceae bacterium]
MNRFTLSSASVALAAIVTSACSSTQTNRVNESSSDYVTSVEIDATPVLTAYDLVNRLRPAWLRNTATGSIGGGAARNQIILVYLDGQRLGSIDALRSVSAVGIRTMQYLDAARAATVLHDVGSDPVAGAIVMTSK